MPKEIELFSKENLVFRDKFYKLMDLFLSTNNNKFEALFYKSIYYIQCLSLFYSEQIHVFTKKSKSDEILIYIQKIMRVKELFRSYYNYSEIFLYIIFVIMLLTIMFFFIICSRTSLNSNYAFNKSLVHTLIKIFLFCEFNIILDICFSNYCFGFSENNPNYDGNIKCNGNISIKIISAIFLLLSIFLKFIFHIFYSDIFIFSSSYFAKISCHYDLYMDISALVNSILMIQVYSLKKELFLVFNFIYSIVILIYYFKYYYIYYKSDMNTLVGIFHSLYAWTSIFSLIFSYINVDEKGIIYFLSSIAIVISFINLKIKISNDLFYTKEISDSINPRQALYFLNIFNHKMCFFDESTETKSFMTGITDLLMSEKSKSKIYKIFNEEKDEELEKKLKLLFKGAINEPNFRNYIVEALLNLYLLIFDERVDIYLNLSLFYLIIIRNYCKSIYIFQKALNLKLKSLEKFAGERLKLRINKTIKQKLKPFSDHNITLENIDVSMYYKYDILSHNFYKEISKEIELSLQFWKDFKKYAIVKNFIIDYNKIFKLTDKIKTTEENIEKMWEDLLKIYNGVNEYFYFYNDYIEQIIDDNLKKKHLDSLKRKNDTMVENINNNYYVILFHKNTGIIIANVDKGSEGIIQHCNKRITNMFNYKISELKGQNVTKLMPQIFETEHSDYIKNYFKKGSNKYVEKQDFKTFAKDKNNSLLQVKLGLKLFPILNSNVFMAAIIIKEDLDDMIILDKDFNIQGMSSKLSKIFNLNSDFFQKNIIPFYAFCKKFINFYNMFLKNKSVEQTQDNEEGMHLDNKNKQKELGDKESPKAKQKEKEKNIEINENIEVNENIELEFEIKIPQFIIDYSRVSKRLAGQQSLGSDDELDNDEEDNKNKTIDSESEEEHEKLPLIHENETITTKNIKHKKTKKFSYAGVKFKYSETPKSSSTNLGILEDLKARIMNEQERIDHRTREEKIFDETINEYITLFNEEKYNDLEDLIDLYNKSSSFSEYKFNFAFDKKKFGNNQYLYMVRCIDNQMEEGLLSDKSFGEINPSSVKYKKEKVESMKPLFELLKEEENELNKAIDSFVKLSMENSRFKSMLEAAKKDIDDLSKIHGQKKEEVLEDENSSQTSAAGFDSGLVKKNKIEEVKTKLFNNSNNFATIRYIKLSMILLIIFIIAFSIIYISDIISINNSLKNISITNLYMMQTCFWTSEIISSVISLKYFYDVKLGHLKINLTNYDFVPLININEYILDLGLDIQYIYDNLTTYLGIIEMEISNFLTNEELVSLYWDHINVSYVSDFFIRDNQVNNESYPSAIDQFLCNCKRFLAINSSDNYLSELINDIPFGNYFNYTTYMIIENGYNSIIPEQLKKLKIMINIFSNYNNSQKTTLSIIIGIFAGCSALALTFFILLIRVTNKALTGLLKKISKIKYDKIEERIKKLEIFNDNLLKFRERDYKSTLEDSKIKSDNNVGKITSKKLVYNKTLKSNNSFSDINFDKNTSDSNFSNGYNLDEKKYISLNILNDYFIHAFFLLIMLIIFLILITIFSFEMIKDINSFLIIEKFFYGKLISVSSKIIEMKCFLTKCQNRTIFDVSEFQSYLNINDIILSMKNFKEIENYYNNKFNLDACSATLNDNPRQLTYELCINNTLTKKGNNTDNLIKIIEDYINNIYNQDEMNDNNPNFLRINLFNSEFFQLIEFIFYNYIYGIDKLLSNIIKSSLSDYLDTKRKIIITFIFFLILINFLFFWLFMLIYIPRLMHFINVTRSVIKIIPTSIIMVTQDLEKWIESKYNNNFSF